MPAAAPRCIRATSRSWPSCAADTVSASGSARGSRASPTAVDPARGRRGCPRAQTVGKALRKAVETDDGQIRTTTAARLSGASAPADRWTSAWRLGSSRLVDGTASWGRSKGWAGPGSRSVSRPASSPCPLTCSKSSDATQHRQPATRGDAGRRARGYWRVNIWGWPLSRPPPSSVPSRSEPGFRWYGRAVERWSSGVGEPQASAGRPASCRGCSTKVWTSARPTP